MMYAVTVGQTKHTCNNQTNQPNRGVMAWRDSFHRWQMGVLRRDDIAPGAAKVALTGQRCTEWPPLQVDPHTGVPTMEDRDTLGARIEQQGPFHSYYITWPGSRLPIDDPKEVSQWRRDPTGNRG